MTEPAATDVDGREAFLDAIDLVSSGDAEWRGSNTAEGHGVIFGGQLLAQTIVAATRAAEGKRVRSVQTVFAKGGSRDHDVTLRAEPLHSGRSFASMSLSIVQGDRLCCRSLVLLDAPEVDFVHHEAPAPSVGPPPTGHGNGWWQVATVGDVELTDSAVGPPELMVWTRFPGAPPDETTAQAMLAYASDGFLIGTAMRPHEGLDQSMAHVTVATTVLTHTLSFHAPFRADDWLLLSQESTFAGGGRAHGRAVVHTADGRHVASFVQDSMMRAMPRRD